MKLPLADTLFQSHPMPSWVVDAQTQRVLAVNDAAVVAFGHSESEFLQQRLEELLAAEVLHGYPSNAHRPATPNVQAEKAGAADISGPKVWRLRHRSGAIGTFELTSASINFDGRAAWLQAAQDVGRERRTEEALRQLERRYRDIVDTATEGVWIIDAEARTTFVNAVMAQMMGHEPADMLGRPLNFFMDAHGAAIAENNLERRRRGIAEQHEFCLQRRDGSTLWVEMATHPMHDAAGAYAGALAMVTDITERRQVHAQLRRSEQDLSITLQSIGDAVIATDVCGVVTRMNTAAERLTGWTVAQASGLPLSQVFRIVDADTRDPATDPAQRLMQTSEVVALAHNTLLLARDGCEHHISNRAAPIRDPDGQIVGIVLVFSDVTEAYLARRALATTKEMLERTSAMAKVGGWELDIATMQPYWSPETCRIHEVDPPVTPPLERALGFYAPEALPTIQAALRSAIAHGSSWDLELPLITAKGRHIWVRTQCFCVIEGGKVVRLRGAFHDITERKHAEQSLLDSKNFNASVIDSLSEQIAVLDAQGVILAINAAWRRYAIDHGAPATLDGLGIGVNYLDVCAKAIDGPQGGDARQTLAGIRAVLSGELPDFHLEYPCHSPTEQRWFQLSLAPMKGNTAGVVVSHTDITERKVAAAALRDGELRYRDLFDSSPQPMWVFDVETLAFLAVNAAAVTQYGYSRDEFLAMTIPDIRPPEEALRLRQYLAELGGVRADAGRWTHRRKDGGLIQVEIASRGLPYGNRPARLVVATDVTARELAEAERTRLSGELEAHRDHLEVLVTGRTAELATARRQADAANQGKSAFLANMSHEIRTPLNAIVGLNYLLRRDGVTPRQAQRLDKIDSAGQHLLSIINDVLDLSKIEAGQVKIESSNFHLPGVLDAVQSIIAESARAKGLAVTVALDGVPPWLTGDSTRLRQALLNFAGNAVKFTERGSIKLRAELMQDHGDQLVVRFSSTDTGIGLAPEQIPRLFQPFEQADSSITRKFGGTGLGLAITRRLAELMKGECGVDSELGVGSTFWFTAVLHRGHGALPAAAVESPATVEELLRRHHRGARVLLAEDNPVNREVALSLLEVLGLQVDTAANGLEVLERVQLVRYDLVLMDMQMPLMGGLQATRALRALPGWQHTPILALTANAFDDDRRACAEAGMSDFIAKPFTPQHLYAKLLRWLGT